VEGEGWVLYLGTSSDGFADEYLGLGEVMGQGGGGAELPYGLIAIWVRG